MDKGFYHPVRGYWQTVGGSLSLADCPEGTIEVPLKPSINHVLQNGEWVYVSPPQPTAEELRAQMPDKTPREFRDILTDMGVFPHMVATKINEIPFDIERQRALNAWEVSTYISRTDPYVDMIGAMFDKSPAEIDAAWVA
ncbi:hypothetical protein [Pseudochrobactrum asaccharolyticum]|uniref:Uncharacterized protein n=1 Tax=Pseudochrobactrum asaccharolyticum TaxID=354351 RepID=A0A366DIJ5_9HYPH|nr:hypothetical protein [Pseudochrobactrum asaccharolyticum]RBO89319.1 hypothetical protein DFR47_11647 [Pseudochrobactrum asaccharolyticum]